MNNFLDMSFFANQQMALFGMVGGLLFGLFIAGCLLWGGLCLWNDIAESRRRIK